MAVAPFRLTMAMRAVLTVLVEHPDDQHYGYTLSRAAGVRPGAMYPILARLHGHGWLDDGWENPEAARAMGRPARRYYTLTDVGRKGAKQALEVT